MANYTKKQRDLLDPQRITTTKEQRITATAMN